MKRTSPVVMLGFHELSPVLMDQFIAEGKLPNFARMKSESQVYITEAQEIAPNLEPWIQWVTVDTGLSYKQHGIFDLAEEGRLGYPRVDEILSQSGRKVWICGSMNASFRTPPNGFFLPDPWSVGVDPYPKGEFEGFFHYVRRNVQESSRERMGRSKTDHLKFLAFMVRHGFSAKSITAIINQLAQERSGKFRWKRAAILDRLQWDVFEHYWRHHSPDYSTFFIQSTANFQHLYWRNMDPSPFRIKPSVEEQAEYKDAVPFGYQSMDRIVGECLEKLGRDTVVILASGLSQQPCLVPDDKGRTFYRANDPEEFFAFAGVKSQYRYAPLLSEKFHLYFKDEPGAIEAERLLRALKRGDRELMSVRRDGQEVIGGCAIFTQEDREAIVTAANGDAKPFGRLLFQMNGLKSGVYHPDGVLWIRDTTKKPTPSQRVSLRQVAPTILAHFGLPKPEFMKMDALPGYSVEHTPVHA